MNLRQLGVSVPPFRFLDYNPNHESALGLPSKEVQRKAYCATVTSSRSSMMGGIDLAIDQEGGEMRGAAKGGGHRAAERP